jgi:hypothetical protein
MGGGYAALLSAGDKDRVQFHVHLSMHGILPAEAEWGGHASMMKQRRIGRLRPNSGTRQIYIEKFSIIS